MSHLKPHEIEGARLHWHAPVEGRFETRTDSRCGRYQIVRTPGNGRGPLFSSLYLLAQPHERRIVGVERSAEAAKAAAERHLSGGNKACAY